MLRPIAKINEYKYICDLFTISIDGSNEPINVDAEMVQEFAILREYDDTFAPLIRVTVSLDRPTFIKVQTSIGKLKVSLRVNKYIYSENEDVNKTVTQKSLYLKHSNLRCLNEEDLDPNMLKLLGGLMGVSDVDTSQDQMNGVTLYLFDPTIVENFRKVIPVNLAPSHTKLDWIYWMLAQRGINNVLMSPLQNNSAGNRFIPRVDLGKSLQYFNSMYSIYDKAPFMYFMDFDTTYLLDLSNPGKALRPGEIGVVSMFLEDPTEPDAFSSGCYVDNTKQFIKLDIAPKVIDTDEMDYLTWGSINTLVSGQNSTQVVTDGAKVETAKVVNGPHMITQDQFNKKVNRKIIDVNIEDVDLSIITPNKKFVMIADKHYVNFDIRGEYIMTSNIATFRKTNATDFIASVVMRLKRIKEG